VVLKPATAKMGLGGSCRCGVLATIKSKEGYNFMTTSDWINLFIAIATFLGVAVAIVAIWIQIHKLNQQLMLQHFADYTKRYQEIILEFPEDINEDKFKLIAKRKNYSKTMRYMRAYFDLCFEEWYLNERKLIDADVWEVWKGGMKAAMSKTVFQQAWIKIKADSDFGMDFQVYLEKLVHQ
jgi:hypothetical protein